ncbi:uncharacterized protein [Rutidosis leptorrhynchoides]|uniref:uncharacterized protein n=1 Tax=Rutidosis leptorrhynchoides TaxID=125765 RepID=UPI003A99A6D2
MLKSVAHHPSIQILKSLNFFRPLSSSFSTAIRSKYHNYYLRKRRKWPHPVYKSRWHQKLTHQHAMQHLQTSTLQINPLTSLINSFNLYNSTPTPNSYHFILKTLIKTPLQSHHIHSVLNHLQKFETFETPESIFIDLIEFYGTNGMFQEAVDLFFRLPDFRCVATVDSFNCLLSVLCKRKEGFRAVPQVLLKIRLMNVRVEGSSFAILIKALCRFKKPLNAIGLLYHMVDDEIEIDQRCFSLILSMLCRVNDVACDEVLRLFEEMKKLGFCVGMSDWENVIRCLVKREKGMKALEAFRRMKSDGFKGDVISYTMVLDGVILEGEYKCADHLFDEMLVLGLVPDVSTYNVYLNGLCKQQKFGDAITMLSVMEELGCKANISSYNIVLSAVYEGGEIGMASDVLKDVRAKGFELNLRTYEIMMCRMLKENDVSKALNLLDEMVHRRLIPQPSTFDEIICELCEKEFVSKALNLMTEMLGKNVLPGYRSWEALISGFRIKSDIKEIDLCFFLLKS